MDLKGPIVSTQIKIIPTQKLFDYIKNISYKDDVPENFRKIIKGDQFKESKYKTKPTKFEIELNREEIAILNQITDDIDENFEKVINANDENESNPGHQSHETKTNKETKTDKELKNNTKNFIEENNAKKDTENLQHLIVSDLDWLYAYLQEQNQNDKKDKVYLHVLLEGCEILTPENSLVKRNPDLEARCVKLRAQQDARDYRKMTKGVDNVRIWYPEDTIAYQLKQLNRQLIAVGQFLLSIFAGFLFGFKGVELMIGGFDFGLRLLLGVICALIIALAEIYFLAKKLNEEMFVPETIQLGGPPKFVSDAANSQPHTTPKRKAVNNSDIKDHQD